MQELVGSVWSVEGGQEGSGGRQCSLPGWCSCEKKTLIKKLLLFVCLCLGFCVLHPQRVLCSANELINGWKG